jgi:hypothetical protein
MYRDEMSPSPSSSWLFSWFDDAGVVDSDALDRVLRDRRRRDDLMGRMEQAAKAPVESASMSGTGALAAGVKADLSGWSASCMSGGCLKRSVDTLFARAWHYFDHVVLVGPSALQLLGFAARENSDRLDYVIRSYFELYNYLRAAGALRYITFSEKYAVSNGRLDDFPHVTAEERDHFNGREDLWVSRMMPGASLEVRSVDSHQGTVEIVLAHPEFDGLFGNRFKLAADRDLDVDPIGDNDKVDFLDAALRSAFHDYKDSLLADINYARAHRSPLGSILTVHEEIIEGADAVLKPSVSDVAFNVPMPFIDGLTTWEILKIRDDEAASFEVFRSALQRAISERIKATDGDKDATDIGVEIANDVIGPALADIENRLDAALRLLGRGAAAGVVAAGTVATVGALAAVPVLGAVAGAAIALPDLRSYLNSRKEIEISEMYYLWKFSNRAMHA